MGEQEWDTCSVVRNTQATVYRLSAGYVYIAYCSILSMISADHIIIFS